MDDVVGERVTQGRGVGRFERRDVKVTDSTESRAVVTGVDEGAVIALVDPEVAAKRSKTSSTSPLPSAGSGPK